MLWDEDRVDHSPEIATIESDEQLVELWLHDKSKNTQDAYRRDLAMFFNIIGRKALRLVTLNDLQVFANALVQREYAVSTQQRRLNSLKSLLNFGYKLRVLPANVGQLLKPPRAKDTLAQRILSEGQVLDLLNATATLQEHALLRLLYATGARISELCDVRWRDLQVVQQGRGQVTLFGKGGRTRVVVFSAQTLQVLESIRAKATINDLIFHNRRGGKINRSSVRRMIRAACKRVGITQQVSPHWFRHAHASHALERDAPVNLVQITLGHASLATTGRYLHARPQDSSGLRLAI
jgi:site-specific recombinase XerD